MKKTRHLPAIFAALFLISFVSAASARDLKLETADAADLQGGAYSLILHGCTSPEDVETMALIKNDQAPYDFQFNKTSYDYARDYRAGTGLTAEEALAQADLFVRCNDQYQGANIRKIVGDDGTLLGYEVRPYYSTVRFGSSDLVRTSYAMNGDNVQVSVVPDRAIQSAQSGEILLP